MVIANAFAVGISCALLCVCASTWNERCVRYDLWKHTGHFDNKFDLDGSEGVEA